MAVAGARRLHRVGIPDKAQLTADIEPPIGGGHTELPGLKSGAKLLSGAGDQQRHRRRRHRAARVIRVETPSPVAIDFQQVAKAIGEPEFGGRQRLRTAAFAQQGRLLIQRLDIIAIEIAAQTRSKAQGGHGIPRQLAMARQRGFPHPISAEAGHPRARIAGIYAHPADIVIAVLRAEPQPQSFAQIPLQVALHPEDPAAVDLRDLRAAAIRVGIGRIGRHAPVIELAINIAAEALSGQHRIGDQPRRGAPRAGIGGAENI